MADPTEHPVTGDVSVQAAPTAPLAPRKIFAGLTAAQLFLCVLGFAIAVWTLWVTQAVLYPKQARFVRADLSRIVGDYVQAQARSAAPPERVEAEMRRFMGGLEREIARRGAAGEVVLVGEAVLSKNVPDVTAEITNSIYASDVPRPRPVSAAQMQAVEAARASARVGVPMGSPVAPAQAAPTGPFGAPVQTPMATGIAPTAAPMMPGASSTAFGGGDGSGR
ncbi:TrbI F-type domain-containing protein [Sphingomonas sp. Leaf4]|uniref:TrbI F-type domain-containing protein n=1 Tax=Sphingomonas sp. Leaf4 TaxID=2876553 RepID=UPI001E64FAA2|nr:TrbI F-type domain-containing protein [Sphingomonas sp. Leaf4]